MTNYAGHDLEEKFYDWLKKLYHNHECNIKGFEWLSQESKETEYDFEVYTYAGGFHFFDVVGWYPFRKAYRLNTKHKSWKLKTDWLKYYRPYRSDYSVRGGYLAFTFDNGVHWRFYKIHNRLPEGDLLLTKERKKNMLSAGWLFEMQGKNMNELKEKARDCAYWEWEEKNITIESQKQAVVKEHEDCMIAFNNRW